MNISNNTVLITGGGDGMGLQLAKEMLALDNTVIICARNKQQLATITQQYPKIHCIQCDLMDSKSVALLIASIKHDFPKLNMLINNAAVMHLHDIAKDSLDLKHQQAEIMTNFNALVTLCDQLLPLFPIGIRINSTDQLEGGLTEVDALEVVCLLDRTSIDLIDISGGTYFPGAKASSDGSTKGPYFVEFALAAKQLTKIPLMLTGGFKIRDQAVSALASGAADVVGLGRAMALNPQIANDWLTEQGADPDFPKSTWGNNRLVHYAFKRFRLRSRANFQDGSCNRYQYL